ncbi:MAG: restriction endonuclease subunit S [Dysgonomonas sp.]
MEENQIKIPEGWKEKEIGKLIKERKKSHLKVSDAANFGQYPFFTSGEAVLSHTHDLIDNENIFLATGGVANIKYFNGKAAYSTDTYTITTSEEVDTQYLFFELLNIIEYINVNYFQGSGLKHLQKKDLKKHIILYPEEIIEQRQINKILSQINETISQTEQLISKYNRIKIGLMQDLLSKGIDENGNIRSEATHKFKDSPLGRIPEEWEVGKLEIYCERIGDGTHASVRFSENEEIPFLFVSCIKPFKIDFEKKASISNSEYELISKGKDTTVGTVLYSLVGSYGNAVTLINNQKLSFQRHIGFIETKRELIDPRFLTLFLNSNFGRKQANDLAVGNAQKTITLSALRNYCFVKPKLNEQLRIINYYNSIENQIVAINNECSKFHSLKIGLMQDLLSGKVRVNHLIKE